MTEDYYPDYKPKILEYKPKVYNLTNNCRIESISVLYKG